MSFLTRLKQRIQAGTEPLDGQAYHSRAIARWHQGDYPAALDDFDMAIRLLPDGSERIAAYLNRARVHRNMENREAALDDLNQVLSQVPTLGIAYLDRGVCLAVQGDSQAGMADLDRAIALLPDGTDKAIAYTNRGSARQELGDLLGALVDYERAIASGPEFTPAYEQRDAARKLLVEGPASSEEGAAAKGTSEAAKVAADLYERAQGFAQEGNLIDALAALTRILEMDPRNAWILYRRGVTLCQLHLYQQALDDLDWAMSLHPRFVEALTEHGLALTYMGEHESALLDFDEALALDPGYALAHENKAFVHILDERWQDALASADMAVRLEPGNAEYRAGRGEVYYRLGRYAEAGRDLRFYLEAMPEGPKASAVQQLLDQLPETVEQAPPPPGPWPPDALWREYVALRPDMTVEEMIHLVQQENAYYAVLPLDEGRWAVASAYGHEGLRDRLTSIADVIGRDILPLRLRQLPDLWQPCTPATAESTREAAWQACVESGGRTVVWEGGQILGVLEGRPSRHYPDRPTALFGPTSAFDREQRSDLRHVCTRCQATFSYFGPILAEDLLIDYACPRCAGSPVPAWIEARMRPNRWSQGGFLAEDERLEQVTASDDATLARLGVTHGEIADALDRLLDTAVTAYQDEFAQAKDAFNTQLIATRTRALDTVAKLTMRHDLDDVIAQLEQGTLPPSSAGARMGDLQVFLQPYIGYQYCPFTILCRPWSEEVPAIPVTSWPAGEVTVLNLETGLALPCRPGQSYRYSDLDFLVINRGTGEYMQGPGLVVHLIRDHHFFEGTGSPYRVDPETAARVLGLLGAGA